MHQDAGARRVIGQALHAHGLRLLELDRVRILRQHERAGGIERVEPVIGNPNSRQLPQVERLVGLVLVDDQRQRADAIGPSQRAEPRDGVAAFVGIPLIQEFADDAVFRRVGDDDLAFLRLRHLDWRVDHFLAQYMICIKVFAYLV